MRLGLALSGGGVRAAVFHLGVLRRLATDGRLEEVEQLSTVSGGSLVIAAMLSKAALSWPTSPDFVHSVYPALRTIMTTADLFNTRAVGWRGVLRFNRKLLHSRAGVLAALLESRWRVIGRVADLPDRPIWWINSTCLETGKNWRFSKREMGDWQFGRHYAPPFSIAEAAAASAAVPYVIGALELRLPRDGWYRTDPATRAPLERTLVSDTVRLWDGGAYENLGLEPVYKPQGGLQGCDFLVCSDASGPVARATTKGFASVLKAAFAKMQRGQLASPRLFDISSDQIRALRSRMFMESVRAGTVSGALVRIGNSVRDIDIKAGQLRAAKDYDSFQSDADVALALNFPTDLSAISAESFDRIARHGFEAADRTLTTYCPAEFPKSAAWL